MAFSDNFNRPDQIQLGDGWDDLDTGDPTINLPFQISSNQGASNSSSQVNLVNLFNGGDQSYIDTVNSGMSSGDYDLQVTLIFAGNGPFAPNDGIANDGSSSALGIFGRGVGTTWHNQTLGVDHRMRCTVYYNGSFGSVLGGPPNTWQCVLTQDAAGFPIQFNFSNSVVLPGFDGSIPHVLKLSLSGTTATAFIDGVQVNTITNANMFLTGPKVGMYEFTTAIFATDFSSCTGVIGPHFFDNFSVPAAPVVTYSISGTISPPHIKNPYIDLTGTNMIGFARFFLENYGEEIPRVQSTGLIAPLKVQTPQATALNVRLWPNDQIKPDGTNYRGEIFNTINDMYPVSKERFKLLTPSTTTITLSGDASATTTPDANGNYTFTGLNPGTYTITPTNASCTFTPPSITVTIVGSNLTGEDFETDVDFSQVIALA
jgi:hypothetical protein